MIDSETRENDGLDISSDPDSDDLVAQMSKMGLNGGKSTAAEGNEIEDSLKEKVMSMSNPIFKDVTPSSKIETLVLELAVLKKKSEKSGCHFEKVVVVSQWTSMLQIVKPHVRKLGLKTAEINGELGGIHNFHHFHKRINRMRDNEENYG